MLGLAGMAFVSELFYKQPSSNLEPFGHRRSVLVRPLLEFSKEDMYKVGPEKKVITNSFFHIIYKFIAF